MKVKEAILLAAIELGIADEVEAYLEDGTVKGMGKKNAELLLTCFNLVESELALDYLPLYTEDLIQTFTGRIKYSDLMQSLVHVIKVEDYDGNPVHYTLFPDSFRVAPGKYKISYTYTPDPKEIEDSSDYGAVAPRLFSYGMAAEFATAVGMYEQAAVWDKKYKEALESYYHATPPAGTKMQSRRWA